MTEQEWIIELPELFTKGEKSIITSYPQSHGVALKEVWWD